MPVQYNASKLIPAPLVTFEKEFIKSGDGQNIGANFVITVRGELIAYKGSPDSTGTFWTTSGYPPDEVISHDERLKSILRKQEALRNLFSEEGHSFEVQPLDGSAPIKVNPRIRNGPTFDEGIWVERCPYTIILEADDLLGFINPSGEDGFGEYISAATESWVIEAGDGAESDVQQQTFRLTHTVSAVGKRHYDSVGNAIESWEQAQDWVLPRLGIDVARITATDVLNLPGYMQGLNHVRSENVDKRDGAYSVTETWLVASGTALEDFTISTTVNADDGLDRVSVNGNIIGLETRDSDFQITQTKYAAAASKFTTVQNVVHSRAQTYSGLILNSTARSTSVARNPVAGNIGYTFDFDNRPQPLVSGARSEVISINEIHPNDIFAAIGVLGRKQGPVLQDIGASGVSKRSVNIELVMPIPTGTTFATLYAAKPDVNAFIASARPTATQVFKEEDTENWQPQTGRFSRQTTWTFEL